MEFREPLSYLGIEFLTGGCEPGFLGKLLGGELATLADPAREEALEATGVPLTVVRVGKIMEAPGGTTQLSCSQVSERYFDRFKLLQWPTTPVDWLPLSSLMGLKESCILVPYIQVFGRNVRLSLNLLSEVLLLH